MKKIGMALISTAIISGVLLFNKPTSVLASGIANTHDKITYLYTDNGSRVNNRALAPNTPWAVGKTISLNGETYYQVATNEYVKAKDVNYEKQIIKNDVTVSARGLTAPVFSDSVYGNQQIIQWGDVYKVNRIVENEYGEMYYQISSHGWVAGDMMEVNGVPQNIEHIIGFNPMSNAIQDNMLITPEEEREILVSQGASIELVNKIPDTELEYYGTVDNWLGGDPGTNYLHVSQHYQLNY